MNSISKRMLAVLLSILMIVTAVPFVSFAEDEAQTGTLTIGSNVTADGVDIDDDVAFTYEITLGGEAFTGTVAGDDGKSYEATNGKLTLPYNVTAVVSSIEPGTSYSVKRLAYDNEKYALVDESSVISGKILESSYFVSVDGGENEAVGADEWNDATNNGETLNKKVYKDAQGNEYTEDDVDIRGGYTGTTDTSSGEYVFVKNTLETITVKAEVKYGTPTESGKFVKTGKAPADYTFSCDGFESKSGSRNDSMVGGKSAATATCITNLNSDFSKYVKEIFESINTDENPYKVVIDKAGSLLGSYSVFSWADNSTQNETIDISSFLLAEDITTYEYSVEYGEADKTAMFDVALAPAPTGTFQINFALDDTVPSGYDGAVFEIKNSAGDVLSQGEDYTLEKSELNLKDLTKNILDWGISIYKFSGLKAGSYTIKQKSTKNGYKFHEDAEYSFSVARSDGNVSGENFDTCLINSSVPCLYNADKSIDMKIYKFKIYLFMNESFELKFNVKDQNKEAVEGSQFFMVESAALLKLAGQLVSLGYNNIGNLNLGDLISSITSADFSNIDAQTIIQLLGAVIDVLPELPEETELTIPAILMASSDKDGVVTFKNSSNILNVLETINNIGEVANAEELAQTIKNLLGGSVPEEYLNVLVKLAKYVGILDVHTGIPSGNFILLNSAAPNGYERNAVMYTIKVGSDGNATTSAGVLIPVIADVINERFDIDIYDILINEEEFNKASDDIKNVFGVKNFILTYIESR